MDQEDTASADTLNEDSGDGALPVSRRELLGLGAGAVLGVAGAASSGVAGADPQGGLGTTTDPVEAAYLDALRGPIVETNNNEITQLVDHRVEETGASISPSAETLVFRYDPNVTL